MKEFEIMIREDMPPTNEIRLGEAELSSGKSIEGYIADFMSGRDNPFNQLIAIYAIRLKEENINRVICIPDVKKNNVILLGSELSITKAGYIMRLQFNGYCHNCKIHFLVE